MKKNNRLFVITLVTLALSSAGVMAAPPQVPQPGAGPFPYSDYDANSDGGVSPDEFYAARDARIASRATGGRMMRNLGNMPAFEDFDTNGDGSLSQDELAAGHAAHMQQHQAMMQQNRPMMQQTPAMQQQMPRGRGGPQGGRGQRSIDYGAFDSNQDGRVSPDEFYAGRDARIASRATEGGMMRNLGNMPAFEDFDTNGDGFLSQDEMAAGHAAHMQQHWAMMQQNRTMMQQNMPMMQQNPAMMQQMPRGRGGRQGGRGQQSIDYGAFDSNQDGRVSPDEFYAGRDARIAERAKEGRMMRNLANMPGFEDFDADGDGYLSQAEMTAGHEARMQQHRAMMQQQMPRRQGGGGSRRGGGRGPGSFSDFDRDGDGVITAEEFSATQAERQGQGGRRW